jgi:hypothetical protein
VRRWLLAAVALSLLVLALVAVRAVFVLPTNPRITKEHYDRIQGGMPRHEVEAILGPPGDYRTGPVGLDHAGSDARFFLSHDGALVWHREVRWQGDEAQISVWLDPTGMVVNSAFVPAHLLPMGRVDWLKWQWERWRNGR